ncbi:glycosyl hydrolase [Caballeronia sp. ATUFL_M2_KS44]|uniref:glycosyl hydrolase n=1 Tax=Caballeronia sp. ATUFL_M2_KS44 TaxID=2921767 RepID=UPI002027E182|nr:glycosyl hydrolase [Caballeronia sp. ATUFL_M2_KS44]
MAGAGGAALSACGGGLDSAGDAAGGVAKSVSKATTTVSASGTTIPPAASITDSSGAVWTLVGGRVMKNGAGVSTGSSVALAQILYFNGIIYAQNSSGVWYLNGSPWKNIGTTDPRTVIKPSNTSLFYGINGHMAWGSGIYYTMTAEQQLAILKDLGVTMYRCDTADAGMSTTLAMALRGCFANSGVGIMPVLNPRSAGWNPTGTEAAAYQLGYDLAVRCTQPLVGLVTHIECGNELDTVGLQIGGDGSQSSDWSPSQWPAFRGVIRGMIAGVKAVDPTIKCGVNVGIPMAYRALQMLWNGISPNGTATGVTDSASLRWDYTTYHWYHSSGKIECAGRNNACINVLQVLKDSFNVPIWLTEWGWSGSADSATAQSAYVQETIASYYAVKDKYNIECIMMYAVIDPSYGLIQGDGVTKTPAYATFKNFIAANPVTA